MTDLDPAVWPAHARRDPDGGISVAGVTVPDLAAEFGTPLFVIDEDDFRGRCREMLAAFGNDAAVHYASKAFLSKEIARWVRDEGLNLDVCSGGELAVALSAGFPAQRIALHGNNKSVAELTYGVDAGIGHIVVDSLSEIARLDVIAGDRAVVQDVLIRLTPGVEAHTHEFISTAHEDQKFGFSLAANESGDSPGMAAVDAVFAAENIRLVGLHSHIGSQIFDVDGFEVAARRVLGLLAQIVARYGAQRTAQLTTIDLGGGLGIAYTSADDPPPVADLAAKLGNIVATEAAALNLPAPHLAVEPGRAIAGPPGITVYEVGTIKDVVLDGHRAGADGASSTPPFRRYVSVDGGMSDNIRTALYGAEYTAAVANRDPGGDAVPSRIVGKHCETGDIVIRDTVTPDQLAEGDLIAVAATGAYCYSMSSRYNMQPRPAVVAVKDGVARLILRRESVEDLMSLEVLG